MVHGLVAAALGGCVPSGATSLPTAADGTLALVPGPTFAELTRGRITVIDFWATWCEPCRVSIPKVIDFAARQSKDVVVVGMHVGQGHDEARRFADEVGIAYPLFADPEYKLSGALGASRVPMIVVLDRQANVVHREPEITAGVAAAVAAAR